MNNFMPCRLLYGFRLVILGILLCSFCSRHVHRPTLFYGRRRLVQGRMNRICFSFWILRNIIRCLMAILLFIGGLDLDPGLFSPFVERSCVLLRLHYLRITWHYHKFYVLSSLKLKIALYLRKEIWALL